MPIHVAPTMDLPIAKIRPNRWNPNVEDNVTFDNLVENIKEVGFVDPLAVRKLQPEDLTESDIRDGIEYEIVGGEHRRKAAKKLGIEVVPCTIVDWDEDRAKAQTVALNIISGKMDSKRFTKLFTELSNKGYARDAIAQMMRFHDSKQMDKFIQSAKASLPPELQKQLAASKKEVRNVAELSNVVNDLLTNYGSTLEQGYVVFTYGGVSNVWIQMDLKLKAHIDRLIKESQSRKVNINTVMAVVLELGAREYFAPRGSFIRDAEQTDDAINAMPEDAA